MSGTIAHAAPKANARTWLGLALISMPCLLYAMDLTVLALAVPQISKELAPSAAQLLWIMDVYGFMVAGFLVTMGTLGDRIGRRRLLMLGGIGFAVTSVMVAYASSAEMLIAARAAQGIAGATLAPSTLSLLRSMFLDDRERTFAIGVWVASFSAGAALGPVFGGLILEHFPWGVIFLINVPLMLLLVLAAPFLLPEFKDPAAGRMDIVSAVQSLAAVLLVIYGLKRLAEGASLIECAIAVALGIAMGVAFVRRQRQLPQPLIDIALFRSRTIASALTVNILGLFTVFAIFLFIAQYFQLVLGMGPLEAGLWTAPSGIVFAIGSMATPLILRYLAPSTVLVWGFVVAAAGYILLTQLSGSGDLALVMTGMIVLCIGLSPAGTITTDIVISAVPPERAGAASAISETSFEFGASAGIAILGSVFTAIYRAAIDPTGLPGLPPGAIEAARESLGGAAEAVGGLAPAHSEALLSAARKAFTDAFAATSALAAVCSLLAALLTARLLRADGAITGR